MTHNRCETCRHAHFPREGNRVDGECHKHAPTSLRMIQHPKGRWPEISCMDWCGDYEAKEAPHFDAHTQHCAPSVPISLSTIHGMGLQSFPVEAFQLQYWNREDLSKAIAMCEKAGVHVHKLLEPWIEVQSNDVGFMATLPKCGEWMIRLKK